MKAFDEIREMPRLMIVRTSPDGGMGYISLPSTKKNQQAAVVYSNGGGWDHVSVSFPNRCPTWDEMCDIKHMFFYPEEVAFELHPPESEYVNNHRYTLHMWRCQKPGAMPLPPSWMVGIKKGQHAADVIREAQTELEGMEEQP